MAYPPLYTGDKNSKGEYEGRGVLTVYIPLSELDSSEDLESLSVHVLTDGSSCVSNVFKGNFSGGLKCGEGQWEFYDGSTLKGVYSNDELNGRGEFIDSDGYRTIGEYCNDQLNGSVEEWDSNDRLVFRGVYKDSVRCGPGELFNIDGGRYVGSWENGEFQGKHNEYFYLPAMKDNVCSLKGEWKDGKMIKTHFYMNGEKVNNVVYSDDESSFTLIAREPLLPDPYEQMCCYVKPSNIKGAGEGLFASIDLPANTIVSFYNGIKQEEKRTERNRWELNSNAIALDEEEGIDIDVPAPYDQLTHYTASLGHKCNSSFDETERNAKYSICQHPRFGLIKSIETLRAVKKDEELLVDYGYQKGRNNGPLWWKKGLKQFITEKAQREMKEEKPKETERKSQRKAKNDEKEEKDDQSSARSSSKRRRKT